MIRNIAKLTTVLATGAALLVPAVAPAKTVTFGTRLDHEPSNSAPAHNCREDGSDDPTPTCTRVAIDMGDAPGGRLTAPTNGTIIKFRIRAGAPGTLTFRLAKMKHLGFDATLGDYSGLGRSDGVGPTVSYQGNGFAEEGNPIETFPAHMKVHKGDYVGFDSTSTSALYCSGGGNAQAIFATPLGKHSRTLTKTDGCELLVQAVMKR